MSTLYKDNLVEITEQEIIFHRYYFPFCGDKHVPLNQIENVEVRRPSVFGGSWRIWGSGDFKTWFPLDGARPSRDAIFVASLHNSSRRIGFTVEHSKEAAEALRGRGLLQQAPWA